MSVKVTLTTPSFTSDDPLTPAEQMRILSQCVKEAKEYYGPEKFWGLRVIYVAIRFVKGMQVSVLISHV